MSLNVAALVGKLWAEEPVIVASLLPAAASAGIISQTQASTLASSISAVGVAVVQVLVAFGVRSKVSVKGKEAAAADPVANAIRNVSQA